MAGRADCGKHRVSARSTSLCELQGGYVDRWRPRAGEAPETSSQGRHPGMGERLSTPVHVSSGTLVFPGSTIHTVYPPATRG